MGRSTTNMLDEPVGTTLVRLAGPMFLGIGAVILFGVVDTFWVSQLGNAELAAMSYTLPITGVVTSVGIALGIGTASATARAIGDVKDPINVSTLSGRPEVGAPEQSP